MTLFFSKKKKKKKNGSNHIWARYNAQWAGILKKFRKWILKDWLLEMEETAKKLIKNILYKLILMVILYFLGKTPF